MNRARDQFLAAVPVSPKDADASLARRDAVDLSDELHHCRTDAEKLVFAEPVAQLAIFQPGDATTSSRFPA